MDTRRWLVRITVLATVLTAFVLSPGVAAAQGGIDVESVVSSSHGTFNGIDYVKYEGRFVGTTAGDYSVPFEIIAPADPAKGNEILIMEPFHVMGGAGGRKAYLTPEFLFDRGFSCAGIGWHPDTVNPFEGYSTEEAVEILHNFALALREDPVVRGMVGNVKKLYGVGLSMTCNPLHSLLHSPGQGLLDFTFLFVPIWPEETHVQPPDAKLVMVFLTEFDLIRGVRASLHTDALRGSSPTYRSYEIAGGPHVPDGAWTRAISMEMFGITSEGTTPLDWTPVARALFLAGHRWATEGIEPPPSISLTQGPEGLIDPVYLSRNGLELETGIARDADGNALAGIRLPDLEIGRGQFIALDPDSFLGLGLFGAFEDLKCEPLADGSARFADHASYVRRYTQQADKLVAEGYLLQEEADRMIAAAAASDVGDPSACAPPALPETGGAAGSGFLIPLLALAGLILLGAGLGLRRWGRESH